LYFSFSAKYLIGFKGKLTFDVFVKLSSQYLLLFKKNTVVDISKLDKYIQKDLESLYVKEEDKYLLKNILGIKDDIELETKNISPEFSRNFKELVKNCINDLFVTNNVTKDTYNKIEYIIDDLINTISTSPNQLSSILSSISDNEYFMYHSTSVSILSIHIARLFSPDNKKLHKIVGLGGFLHDIGKAKTKEHELNPVLHNQIILEKNYLEHPSFGYNSLSSLDFIPDEVKLVILQHHERPNGKGFPSKLRNPQIFLPSKIVATANDFSKYIAKHPFGHGIKPIDAVKKLLLDGDNYGQNIVNYLAKVYGIGVV